MLAEITGSWPCAAGSAAALLVVRIPIRRGQQPSPAALVPLGIGAAFGPGGGSHRGLGVPAEQKLPAMDQLAARHQVTHLGMPVFRPSADHSSGAGRP